MPECGIEHLVCHLYTMSSALKNKGTGRCRRLRTPSSGGSVPTCILFEGADLQGYIAMQIS
jgi:hypothetical protein